MPKRDTALPSLAVLSLVALPACTSTVNIPAIQAPALADDRAVITMSGQDEKIGPEYTVTLVPHDGWELMRRDTNASFVVPIREDDADIARDSGWLPAPVMKSPLSASFNGPTLVLQNHDDRIQTPIGAISSLEVRSSSPGKTTGLVVGIVLGTVAVGVGIGVAVAFASLGGIR